MKVDLAGKVALVTGAAQGIGQAIADALAENGARVIYTDVQEQSAATAAARHAGCWSSAMDVTQPREIDAVIKQIVEREGRLDILVNNAGVNTIKHRVTIDEFPRDEWDRILSV